MLLSLWYSNYCMHVCEVYTSKKCVQCLRTPFHNLSFSKLSGLQSLWFCVCMAVNNSTIPTVVAWINFSRWRTLSWVWFLWDNHFRSWSLFSPKISKSDHSEIVITQSTDNIQIDDLYICSLFLGQEIYSLEDILKEGGKCDWENIKKSVTASALCEEENPIDKAFEVR